MQPKKILYLCDASDLEVVEKSFSDNPEYELTVETSERILEYGVRDYLLRTIELIKRYPEMYDGVVGTHDSSAVFAAIICDQTGKRFASVDSVINCQNKYLSRLIQHRHIPEHTPGFCLAIDLLNNSELLPSPFFIKPSRANISFGSHIIDSLDELIHFIGLESNEIVRQNSYFLEALSINPKYQAEDNLTTCNTFLCEEFVSGEQITVDGFIFDGQVSIFGMTRAVFHTGTYIFHRHEFPYTFGSSLDAKISEAVYKLIPALGLDNSFFNVELRADPEQETFQIIEVNSRIAFQFAKTIESVTAFDPLHLLLQVAVGEKPQFENHGRTGKYPYCFNFELHSFSDKQIIKTPTQSGYEEIKLLYPDVVIRNLIQEGFNLSDYKHNPQSYRYCFLDIPGNSPEEILFTYDRILNLLDYEFWEMQ